LGVGIDWAEAFHLVALGHPDEGLMQVLRVEHTPAAVDQLSARIAALEPVLAEVRVVLETRHGLLVERLLDAGYTVLPVNPDLIARRCGPARKNDDAEDARLACLLALDRHTALRPVFPTGSWLASCGPSPATTSAPPETSAGCSTGSAGSAQHLPGRATAAGDDLGAPTILKLLERWPTRDLLAASREELVAFTRTGRHGGRAAAESA